MMEVDSTCANCKWYFCRNDADDVGECRRYPPQVVGVELWCDGNLQKPLEDQLLLRVAAQTNWPSVDDNESCGEFARKANHPETPESRKVRRDLLIERKEFVSRLIAIEAEFSHIPQPVLLDWLQDFVDQRWNP